MLCVHSSLTLQVYQLHGKGRDPLPTWVQSYGTHPTVLPGQHHPQDLHNSGQYPHLLCAAASSSSSHTVQSSQAIPRAFPFKPLIVLLGHTLSSLG